MNEKQITLTQVEIEEIKDEVKFRTKVIESLKRLNCIPDKVISLEIHSKIHWFFISVVLIGLVGMTWRILAK